MRIVEIANSRVLITGGAGLIGSHIADRLVLEGVAEILIIDNFSRGTRENLAWVSANGPVTVIEEDIRDRQAIAEAMQGIDLLFHVAAIRITQCARGTSPGSRSARQWHLQCDGSGRQGEGEKSDRRLLSMHIRFGR